MNDKPSIFNIQTQQLMDTFPWGISVFKADQKLTLLYANPNFYNAIEYNKEEVKSKFGNCMSALLPVHITRKLLNHSNKNDDLFEVEIPIKGKSHRDIYLRCLFNYRHYASEHLIVMLSFDITDYIGVATQLEHVQKNAFLAFKESHVDLFEFDKRNGQLSSATCQLFFPQPVPNVIVPQYFIDSGHILKEDEDIFLECFKNIVDGDDYASCELRIHTQDNNQKWAKLILNNGTIGDENLILGVILDITAEKESTMKFLQETMFYQTMLSDQDAYGHVDVTEDQFSRVGGLWNLYNEIISTITYTELYNKFIDIVVHPDDRVHYKETMLCENLIDAFKNGVNHLGCDFRRIVEQNKMVWMRLNIHLFKNPINNHIMALMYIKNIDIEKKELLELKSKNDKDYLTNLFSSKSIQSLIEEALNYQSVNDQSYLILINIDSFNQINRDFGYDKGDQILKDIADEITNQFFDQDLIGRFNGDEFIILFKHSDSKEKIEQRLHQLQEVITSNIAHSITLSSGVTNILISDDFNECVTRSRIGLNNAKRNGNGQIYFNLGVEKSVSKAIKKSQEIKMSTPVVNEDIDALLGEEGEIAYLVDPKTFELLAGNNALYNRLGKSRAECEGKKCYELLHGRTSSCAFCRKESWTNDKYYMYRNYNHVLEQEFIIKNKLVQWQGKSVLLALAIDLSNNKSIVDSLENDTTENNCILSGIKNMQNADTVNEVYQKAMEAISAFFRANSVHFWLYSKEDNCYYCNSSWVYQKNYKPFNQREKNSINRWLNSKKWIKPIKIENYEVMLCESYEVYQVMMEHQLSNQLWVPIRDEDDEMYGVFEIDNVSINFQNTSFMESFISFINSEKNKREMFKDIIYRSFHDDLTDLLNRASYDDYLKKFTEEQFSNIAVISANINGLSTINSEHGVPFGDYVLIQFAKSLTETFVDNKIFRLNGDEFVIILIDSPLSSIENKIKLLQQKVKQIDAFTFSIGYAWDDEEKNINKMLEIATESMQLNKEHYYDRLDKKRDNHHYRILNELVQSLDNREFEVYLQAKIDTSQNKMVGAEALIRYVHKDFGVIPPIKFIPSLEENNIIRYVDLFVLEEVCRTLQKWQEQNIECPLISLNFSRKTLQEDGLIEIMNQLVEKYGVNKKYIEIEITEGHAEVGKAILYQTVHKIRKAGFAVSLDDFGTNYTNLSILSELDFDTLKIDRSLIHSIVKEEKNRIILKKVIEMCKELHVEVIAEGVDSVEQQDILTQMGCMLIQGYLFSKPIPIPDFENQYIK